MMSGRVLDLAGPPVAERRARRLADLGRRLLRRPGCQPAGMNLRGLFTTGADGRFFFRTVKPSSYPIPTDGPVGRCSPALGRHPMRPAHIHFIIGADSLRAGDHPYVRRGRRVSRLRRGLRRERQPVVPFVRHDDLAEAALAGIPTPFYTAEHEFVLVRR